MQSLPKINRRDTLKMMVASLGATSLGSYANTQYPNRAITWVVPYAAGAATDILTRLLAKEISADLGQPVVIENVPGAGTINAAVQLTRNKPDGYRVMTADSATLALNPALIEKLPYDAQKSFTSIGMFARFPLYLVVNKDLPANNLTQLVDYITQTKKSELNYGSAGMGSPHHMAMELLQETIGSNMVHVPYTGTGPALTDLLGGRLDLMLSSLGPIASHVKAGALKVIASTGDARFPTTPAIPTIAESDPRFKDYKFYAWQGVVSVAALPEEIQKTWAEALAKASQNPAIQRQFLDMGIEAVTVNAADFKKHAADEKDMWVALAKSRGIKRE